MKKILVIEDDINILDIMGFTLENNGYEMLESQKKLSVKEIAKLNPILIIIDYLLADCFGNDLCLEIKSEHVIKHLPVILYSASEKIERLAYKSCADAFIAGPFESEYFLQLVNKWAL